MHRKYLYGRIAVSIAIVLWFMAVVKITVLDQRKAEGSRSIVTAFNEADLNKMTARIEGFGEYGIIYLSAEAKEKMLRDIAEEIGINRYTINTARKDHVSTTTLEQMGSNGNVKCTIMTVEKQLDSTAIQATQYVSVEIELYHSVDKAFAYEEKIREIMDHLDVRADVTVQIEGTTEGS